MLESAVGGSFAQQYAGFVAANLLPGSFYAEGKRYAQPYPDGSALNAGQSTGGSTTLNHLTSLGGHVVPGTGLEDTTWNLRVTMDGPDEVTSPMLVVVWKGLDGKVRRYVVDTDASGAATQVVKFSSTNTQDVYFALVDAGDRYSCSQGTDYACAGVSKDDSQPFAVTLQTVQG